MTGVSCSEYLLDSSSWCVRIKEETRRRGYDPIVFTGIRKLGNGVYPKMATLVTLCMRWRSEDSAATYVDIPVGDHREAD